MLSALAVDPKRFRLSTLVSMGDRARHELALRAAGTVASCKLTLGRCLLAIQETRDYRNHGCSGSTHYAMSKLGVSKKEANESKRVARELLRLPELSMAAEEGRITWCKLREIVRVATPETEDYWMKLAEKYTGDQIQFLVSKSPQGSVPGEAALEKAIYSRSEIRCKLEPTDYQTYLRAQRACSIRKGQAVTLRELIMESMKTYLSHNPIDENVSEKVDLEMQKDLEAERARVILMAAECRELAVEMGLLGADEADDAEWGEEHEGEPDLEALGFEVSGLGLRTGFRKSDSFEASVDEVQPGKAYTDEMDPGGAYTDEVQPGKAYTDEMDPDGVQVLDLTSARSASQSCPENSAAIETWNAGRGSDVNADLDRLPAVEIDPGGASTDKTGPSKIHFAESDPDRAQRIQNADCFAEALKMANFDIDLLTEPNPETAIAATTGTATATETATAAATGRARTRNRSQYRRLKNPWASTRVRFNIDARYLTKHQRKEILRRDCWCCSTPGCPNRIWLHVHHLEPFAKGGKTEPKNLIGLCTACHQNVHDGYLIIQRQPNGTHLFFDKLGNRLDQQVDLEMAYWLDFEIGWKGGPEDSYKHRCGVDWTLFAG